MGDYVGFQRPGVDHFQERASHGVFVGHCTSCVNGAWVLVLEEGVLKLKRARMPMLLDKPVVRWKTSTDPEGDRRVWVASDGRVIWQQDAPEGMLTVEERLEGPDHDPGDLERVIKKRSWDRIPEEALQLFGMFGHGLLMRDTEVLPEDLGPDADEPEVIVVDSAIQERDAEDVCCKKVMAAQTKENTGKYKILPYEIEQEMNRAEVRAAQLVTDTVDARILSDPRTSEEENAKWVNEGLRTELGTLEKKEIFEEVDEANLPPGAKVLPAKVVLTKKPRDGDAVECENPLDEWRAKARIVVCGNYEADTFGHDPSNSSANPAIEHIRWSAACLASHPDWTGLVLDVTAAFLNADMDNDTTFVRPPKVLYREGLIKNSKVWRLRKVLYGLRKGPKLWEVCRNEEIDYKEFDGPDNVTYYLDPISSGVWAIRKKGEPTSFVGFFDMYVDDGLLGGPLAICKALAEVLLKTWEMKLQGFLPCDGLEEGAVVQLGDTAVRVKKAIPFLGMVIKRSKDGVCLHQHPWITAELEKRGWTSMAGATHLPEVVEGQTDPAPRDDQYGADLQRAQSEVGSLFWLGLRTRPDLLATVGSLSCLSTVDPRRTYKLATQVWKYVAGTRAMALSFPAGGDLKCAALAIFGDASLAPGASRSRTGVVVKFGEHVLAYKTQRQSLTAFSAFEAEVEASATAYQVGTQVKSFVEKFLGAEVEAVLYGDNSACVANLTKGSEYIQPTRTRHFGMRCSYLRDHLRNDGIPMKHMSGEQIPADGLTKTLARLKLEKAREQLSVR